MPTGFQRAPYFQIQTDRFALLAVDTGVLRRVDPDQWAWLRSALEQGRGKFTMVILGHPLYAGGHYQAGADEEFLALHRLLREHEVAVVMAGDTHDLELYVERYRAGGGERVMHHVVNGDGGAYLSFATALAWPAQPAVPDWAFYPGTSSVLDKLERHTPRWKWPFWVWTKRFGAWPFSAELLSAAFDYNVAPFFQSFVEVRVEPSAGPCASSRTACTASCGGPISRPHPTCARRTRAWTTRWRSSCRCQPVRRPAGSRQPEFRMTATSTRPRASPAPGGSSAPCQRGRF